MDNQEIIENKMFQTSNYYPAVVTEICIFLTTLEKTGRIKPYELTRYFELMNNSNPSSADSVNTNAIFYDYLHRDLTIPMITELLAFIRTLSQLPPWVIQRNTLQCVTKQYRRQVCRDKKYYQKYTQFVQSLPHKIPGFILRQQVSWCLTIWDNNINDLTSLRPNDVSEARKNIWAMLRSF